MKITILNGNPESTGNSFDAYLTALTEALKKQGHEVVNFVLRDMQIRQCRGCWGCWVKTPGKCVHEDDAPEMLREIINSDVLLESSPVIMGFLSAMLKRAKDKTIPLLLPYIALFEGECHHKKRYDKYPQLGLLVQPGNDSDEEDLEIIQTAYRRNCLNFHSKPRLFLTTDTPAEEAANAINGI